MAIGSHLRLDHGAARNPGKEAAKMEVAEVESPAIPAKPRVRKKLQPKDEPGILWKELRENT